MTDSKNSDEKWRNKLNQEQFRVCRQKGTEAPFSGRYYNFKGEGIYRCVCCGQELFHSDGKFDSGTGWPSFTAALKADAVHAEMDDSHNMIRTEVTCSNCGAHLGHVFDDGPAPSGKRYCINSVSLEFEGGCED